MSQFYQFYKYCILFQKYLNGIEFISFNGTSKRDQQHI